MIDAFNQYESNILGVQMVEKKEVFKYGIIDGIKINNKSYTVIKS